MSRKLQHNIPRDDDTKNQRYLYLNDDATWRLFPSQDQWRARFIHVMLKWAEASERNLTIRGFCRYRKMSYGQLKHLFQTYPDVREAYEIFKGILGDKHYTGALLKELDREVTFRDLHHYLEEWHAVNVYHAELNSKKDEQKELVVNLRTNRVTGKVKPNPRKIKGDDVQPNEDIQDRGNKEPSADH